MLHNVLLLDNWALCKLIKTGIQNAKFKISCITCDHEREQVDHGDAQDKENHRLGRRIFDQCLHEKTAENIMKIS